MRKIKVLLASRPKMLSDVIRNMVERQPDMEAAGEVLDPIALLLAVRAMRVDMVIVTPLDFDGESRISCLKLHKKVLNLNFKVKRYCSAEKIKLPSRVGNFISWI